MNLRARASRAAGFTLVELLVVIAILGILVAALMPAVQLAREAARKSTCGNNLKQITTALVHYDTTYRKFPYGNLQYGSNGPTAYGHTWWVRILPFVEEVNVADNYDWTDPAMGELPNNTHNFSLLRNYRFDFMVCPSSPLPKEAMVPGSRQRSRGPCANGPLRRHCRFGHGR